MTHSDNPSEQDHIVSRPHPLSVDKYIDATEGDLIRRLHLRMGKDHDGELDFVRAVLSAKQAASAERTSQAMLKTTKRLTFATWALVVITAWFNSSSTTKLSAAPQVVASSAIAGLAPSSSASPSRHEADLQLPKLTEDEWRVILDGRSAGEIATLKDLHEMAYWLEYQRSLKNWLGYQRPLKKTPSPP
jgi:hypothetical protein